MKETLRFVLVLTAITALSGLVLGLTEKCTREPIALQNAQQQRTALLAVLPPIDNAPDRDVIMPDDGQSPRISYYRGRRDGKIVGVAFVVVAEKGYGGPITMMVGVTPGGTLTGLEILGQNETPGLGNRIAEPDFRRSFIGRGLDDYRWRVRKDGGDFDQISGATISSRAVVESLATGLQRYRDRAAIILEKPGGTP